MLKKNYSKTGKVCRVTFKLPPEVVAENAAICGEFNKWDKTSHRMKPLKKGGFSLTVSLQSGKSYCFRYLLDEKHWLNDKDADQFVRNGFGSENCLIQT